MNIGDEVAQKAKELIEKEQNNDNVITDVIIGDSRTISLDEVLKKYNIKNFQLLIMHPPYHDIIKFSNDERDLSNARYSYKKFYIALKF